MIRFEQFADSEISVGNHKGHAIVSQRNEMKELLTWTGVEDETRHPLKVAILDSLLLSSMWIFFLLPPPYVNFYCRRKRPFSISITWFTGSPHSSLSLIVWRRLTDTLSQFLLYLYVYLFIYLSLNYYFICSFLIKLYAHEKIKLNEFASFRFKFEFFRSKTAAKIKVLS